MDCLEEQIDRRLPFGNEYSELFGTTNPDALASLPVMHLQVGAIIELIHVATGVKLAYRLASGVAPADNVFDVTPVDYNAGTNQKYWVLTAQWKDGSPLVQNTDLPQFNLLAAKGSGTPQMSLSNSASRVVQYSAFGP
jgi:hypothetical protein